MFDEVQQFQKRIEELAEKSYTQGIYVYTGFLGMGEQDLAHRILPRLSSVGYTWFGGREHCERQMLRFGSPEELGYEEEFPIVCLLIRPVSEKFAQELGHRDFLGAIMNLGITRSTIGDIWIRGKAAYVFCEERMAAYVVEHLEQVRHTKVKCSLIDAEADLEVQEPELVRISASSERLDGVIAKLYHLSRTQSAALFSSGKVFRNGSLCESSSLTPKPGDVITVRGFGRFLYHGISHETKKGKWSISVGMYR